MATRHRYGSMLMHSLHSIRFLLHNLFAEIQIIFKLRRYRVCARMYVCVGVRMRQSARIRARQVAQHIVRWCSLHLRIDRKNGKPNARKENNSNCSQVDLNWNLLDWCRLIYWWCEVESYLDCCKPASATPTTSKRTLLLPVIESTKQSHQFLCWPTCHHWPNVINVFAPVRRPISSGINCSVNVFHLSSVALHYPFGAYVM